MLGNYYTETMVQESARLANSDAFRYTINEMREQRKQINNTSKLYGYVERLFHCEGLSADEGRVILPHPNCHLIINLTDTPVAAYYLDRKGHTIAKTSAFNKIYHLHTKPVRFGRLHNNTSIGVYFEPFALPAFTHTTPFTNRIINASGIFPHVAQLRTSLMQALPADRLAILEAYLNHTITPLPEPDLTHLRTMCNILAKDTSISLDEVAAQVGVTKRGLHTLATKYTGLTPKSLSHVYVISRFIDFINQSSPPVNWREVAAELGLYDQSHFIKLFKNFTGLTPTEWFSTVMRVNKPADEWVHTDLSTKG